MHLLLDTGHATFAGADPAALARRHRARISHVHTKDVRADVMVAARERRLSFLDAVIAGVFTVPGDGCVDYPAVFRELPGYAGWVVVEAEQDPAKAHPLTYAKLGYRNLRKYLADAGCCRRANGRATVQAARDPFAAWREPARDSLTIERRARAFARPTFQHHRPILLSTSAFKNRSTNSMNRIDGTSRISAVIEAIW